jgi:hypothetical protein
VYFAPGACHAPHHVPKEWADRYRGKFNQGWDKLREEIFARQKQMGLVPQNADLTKRPKEIEAWDEVDPKMKPILARQMEVYAGFLEHTDHHVGRLFEALKDLGIFNNTLIFVIIGDNGASAEGTPNGTYNEMLMLNGILGIETPEFLAAHIDKFFSLANLTRSMPTRLTILAMRRRANVARRTSLLPVMRKRKWKNSISRSTFAQCQLDQLVARCDEIWNLFGQFSIDLNDIAFNDSRQTIKVCGTETIVICVPYSHLCGFRPKSSPRLSVFKSRVRRPCCIFR